MDILFSSATQLAAAISARNVSAVEVLEAHLAQIEKHNPVLNAIVTMDAERSLERARAADAALARGESWGPLHGVPFTLKDSHSTAGMRTTVGCAELADNVPGKDSTVTARLKGAGGILIGKTNVPEMLDDWQSCNPVFGCTSNPWDIERTPGGSSGGAAAAVASGMSAFDIGSDLSGSLRVPAHFCGIFGLKPTEHRVSSAGFIRHPGSAPQSIRIMASIGPLARTVEDLALLYRLIAGPDGCDTDVPPVPVEAVPELELEDLRIAFAPNFPGFPVAEEIRDAVSDLAEWVDPLSSVVEEAALPYLNFSEEGSIAGELIDMMIGVFHPKEGNPSATLSRYAEALERRDRSIRAWEEFFENWDILLCPAAMVTAFPHRERGTPLQVDDDEVQYSMVGAHTTLFNYTGHPAIVLPYELDEDGLPIGVQMVGKRWGDSRLLGIAAALSRMVGKFWQPIGY